MRVKPLTVFVLPLSCTSADQQSGVCAFKELSSQRHKARQFLDGAREASKSGTQIDVYSVRSRRTSVFLLRALINLVLRV